MIQRLLADYCRKKYFGNNERPVQIGVYRPSVLSWSCLRKQWNYYKNFHNKAPEEIPDDVVLLLSGGIVFHRLLQSLKDNGRSYWDKVEVECKVEVQLPSGVILIVGHADALKNGKVYEFKHVRTLPSKPRFEHILQLNFYLKALNSVEGVLLYAGYAEGGGIIIREFPWRLSPWHFQHLVNRAEMLHIMLMNDTPPQCSCSDKRHEYQIL